MENKTCNKCNKNKNITDFYFRKDLQKHRNSCIACEKARLKEYYSIKSENRKEYSSKYYNENKEVCLKKCREYRKKESIIKKTKEYNKQYKIKNKEKLLAAYRKRKKNDSLFKLKENIRSLIIGSFKKKGYKKTSKAVEILGCQFEEFKIYLENQFESWMNWSNHGLYDDTKETWQIDHIIPASSAKNEAELIQLNHFSNLRPLCAKKNNTKSNKITYLHQDKIDGL